MPAPGFLEVLLLVGVPVAIAVIGAAFKAGFYAGDPLEDEDEDDAARGGEEEGR